MHGSDIARDLFRKPVAIPDQVEDMLFRIARKKGRDLKHGLPQRAMQPRPNDRWACATAPVAEGPEVSRPSRFPFGKMARPCPTRHDRNGTRQKHRTGS
jgi:hypothetical protein